MAVGLMIGIPIMVLILSSLDALRENGVVGLPVVPWQTLWALPLDRWLRDVAAALTLGFLIVGGLLLGRPQPRLLRVASLSAIVWLAALVAMLPLTVSELLGRPLEDSLDPVVLRSLLVQTDLGRILIAQTVLVALVAALGWAVLGRVTAIIVVGLAVAAAGLPALTGHSGLHSGHTSASISLGFHLLAVGIWVGGLVAVCRFLLDPSTDGSLAATAIRRFSVLALVCVIVLAESGLLNASLRMDGPSSLITTPYGALIMGKATLLAALIILGWRQRRHAVPHADTSVGRSYVLRLAGFEMVLMGLALGLSVALSRTAPPAGAVAGDRITAAALGILALAIPLVIVWAGGVPSVVRRWTANYPEPFAMAVVVAAIVAAAVIPSGLLGISVAAMAASVLLVLIGWLFAVAAIGSRGLPAIVVVMVLWPVALWWAQRSDPTETSWQIILAVMLAEACLVMLLLVRRARLRGSANVAVDSHASVQDTAGVLR